MLVRTLSSIEADDVANYRSMRLAALETDPSAFGSTHEREAAFGDDDWRRRLASFAGRPGVVQLAERQNRAVGMVGIGRSERSEQATLWGMWVDPPHRRAGIARRLLESAVAWAVHQGCDIVALTVMRSNARAISLYESHGFAIVDAAGVSLPVISADEFTMIRALD